MSFLPSFVSHWKKAQSTNSTSSAFAALVPTKTKPAASATRSVFPMSHLGLRDQNTLVVKPFGGNDNNDTFNVKVSGWNFIKQSGKDGLWVSTFLCQVLCTLSSTLVGLAGEDVAATEFFCDTLSLTTGSAVLRQGTADVDIAEFLVDVSGHELVEITYDIATGADAMNALVRFDA